MANTEKAPETPKNVLRKDSGPAPPWYRLEIGPRLRAATLILFEKYRDLSGPRAGKPFIFNCKLAQISRQTRAWRAVSIDLVTSVNEPGKFGSTHALASGVS